jgi:hypothetical protein
METAGQNGETLPHPTKPVIATSPHRSQQRIPLLQLIAEDQKQR